MENTRNSHYIPGLDGLRAIAMLFIIGYHFGFGWSRGGFLGVDIFFVLSGYLVTLKILSLKEGENHINLKRFWSERIRRLLPSAYVMIATTVVWVILFNKELLAKLWGDLGSSILYMTNWWFIFHKLSYFDSFGTPSPLKHLWFLAVQEQVFFILPILLAIGLRYLKSQKKLSILIFTLALCSAGWMGILYNPEGDPSRVYYGTDTRSFELLIGSCLALIFPIKNLLSLKTSLKGKYGFNIISIITVVVFLTSAVFVDEYRGSFLYRGGMFLFSFNTALLILSICHPGGGLEQVFSWKPLRWIGRRAYGLYLWHYPIIVLSTPVYEIGNLSYWRVSLQLVIIFILAELNYRFIETPIRKLGLREFYKHCISLYLLKWRELTLMKKFSLIAVCLGVAVLVVATGAAKNEEKTQPVSYVDCKTTSCENDGVNFDETVSVSSIKTVQASVIENDKVNSTQDGIASSNQKNETNSSSLDKTYVEMLAIGDSVMLNIASNLETKYTNITVDGKVSRQMSAAIKLASAYAKFNNPNKAVIIELGTNGPFTDTQIDSVLDSFSKADIYLVNTRVPRNWEKTVNEILKKKADERENVTLVDWYSVAINHPEYFGGDGVHLTSSGAEVLVNAIDQVVSSNLTQKESVQ